jgi:CO/xanthine dehydrogenase Mo-binding subunit
MRAIHYDPGVDWSSFIRVTAADIPGRNVGAMFDACQPVLASDELRHYNEPIALVAHPSQRVLRRALSSIRIEVDELPPYRDFRFEPQTQQCQVATDNILHRTLLLRGDPDEKLRQASRVVEGVYETGSQEHLYLETHAMTASWNDSGVTIYGSLQCPGYVRQMVARVLGMDVECVRVAATQVGGGFGGKEDYPSLLAAHAALLARAAGFPVRMVYDRAEDMSCTTKRHAARIRHRTAVGERGELLAMDVDILLDGGAYATLTPLVLNRATIHACGPYRCDHVRINGRARMTNTVPSGAFRGFGNPQVHFAIERHIDRIATTLGIQSAEVRRQNLLRNGDVLPTGQVVEDGIDMHRMLDRALELASADRRVFDHHRFNAREPWRRRGLGIACSYHGCGLPSGVEEELASKVSIEVQPPCTVRLLTSIVEMGQGVNAVFRSLVAERLGLDEHEVELATVDSETVPESGPSVASRTSMVIGLLVQQACDNLRERLGLGRDARGAEVRQCIHDRLANNPCERVFGEASYQPATAVNWDPASFRGEAYPAFGWATQVAEVEVDLCTGQVNLRDLVSVQDVGTILNPLSAAGQVHGGVAQALGWALTEQLVSPNDRAPHTTLADYLIPTAADLPEIKIEFVETSCELGANGARGLGELPMVGTAAAIVNGICQALDASIDRIPASPESVLLALQSTETEAT